MWVSGQFHAPKLCALEGTPVPNVKEPGWTPEQVWTFSLKRKSLNATRNLNPGPSSPQRVAILRRGLHWATLHTTRRRLHSQACERAASKLTTPVTWTNVIAGQSATRVFVLLEQNCVYHSLFPSHINYIVRVYKRDIKLTSEGLIIRQEFIIC